MLVSLAEVVGQDQGQADYKAKLEWCVEQHRINRERVSETVKFYKEQLC